MRSWLLRGLAVTAGLALIGLLITSPNPADSQVGDMMHLSLEMAPPAPGVLGLQQAGIPGDCSTWHELWPAYCTPRHQDAYNDNGDGVLSLCDEIVLDGVVWHVKWVGPTYYMTCLQDGSTGAWEPSEGPHNPDNPIGEVWHEVWPNFCMLFPVDDWFDNDQSGSLTPCDEIFSGGLVYHIDDIGIDIIVGPVDTPAEPSTWGKVKRFFGL